MVSSTESGDRPRPPGLRWAGTGLLAGLVALTFDPSGPALWQWMILAGSAAAITWLLASTIPVLLTTAFIAIGHSDLQAPDLARSLVYPLLAAASTVTLCWVLLRRFNQVVADTRSARTAARRERNEASTPP